MPMRDPTTTTAFSVPSEIKANEMYIGTLVETECRPYAGKPKPPKYDRDGNIMPEVSIVWKFTLREHNALRKITNQDGTSYEQWRFTSDATSGGSIGREVIHALAGREVTDKEVSDLLAADPDRMPTKLYGKSCLVILGYYTDRNNQQQVGIAQLLPISASDKTRLGAKVKQEKTEYDAAFQPAAPAPQVQFTQQGQEVRMGPARAPQKPLQQQVVQPSAVATLEEDEDGDIAF